MNPDINYINRNLEPRIANSLNQGKVIIIYGARQTGKTTLVKNFFAKKNLPYVYLSCEEPRIQNQLVPDHLALKRLIGNQQNIVLDEAQKLANPGLILKILIDNFPQLNVIATGSSSFDLANKLNEPLTGRNFRFELFPLSYSEIKNTVPSFDFDFRWKETLIFGAYPEVFLKPGKDDKITRLQSLSGDYLYKDILTFGLVKDSNKIRDLLTALALQIGHEVSYHELSKSILSDYKTVERYIELLEKSFIIFRLRPFSRNLRSELNRKVKIYFYDLGVRNSILNSFNDLSLRQDAGALFENYIVLEKIKTFHQKQRLPNYYFWRTYDQKEIDFIQESDGEIQGLEIKWSEKAKVSKTANKAFTSIYKGANIKTVTPANLSTELL